MVRDGLLGPAIMPLPAPYLPSTALAVLSPLDDSGQVQELQLGPSVPHDTGNASECCELVICRLPCVGWSFGLGCRLMHGGVLVSHHHH